MCYSSLRLSFNGYRRRTTSMRSHSLYICLHQQRNSYSVSQCTLRSRRAKAYQVQDSILFLTFSMFTIACFLYLPDHISIISRRVCYYFAGDIALLDASRTAAIQLGGTASKASEAVLGAASDFAGAAYEAAKNTAAVAQEAMNQAAETLTWT